MSGTRPALVALDRVRLYLTLVPYLLERDAVPLSEAAADFGVTEPQLREMVERLTVIGLPGEDGYWQPPQDLFDIDWDLLDQQGIIRITHDVGLRRVPRLSAREAAALIAGLHLVASLPGVADSDVVTGLLAKLSRGATTRPADVVVVPPEVDAVRESVADAVHRNRALSFTYQALDAAPTQRTVDPVRIVNAGAEWYLQGWCHLRQAMRTFHLDRIRDVTVTAQPRHHGAEPAPALFTPGEGEGEVVVDLPVSLRPLLEERFPYARLQTAADELRARIRMSDPRGIRRLAARFGGALEVRAPATARSATREWAEAGLAQYDNPTPPNSAADSKRGL